MAVIALVTAGACALIVTVDILAGRRQRMKIMNVVWPVTTLWSGPIGLWAYFAGGRAPGREKSFPEAVAVAATHCGAGCTLGDLAAEWIHYAIPFTIAGFSLVGAWALDFAAAFALGIAFQYFTIVPMRHLPFGQGLLQAFKADALSLTAWQVGMYGWMAIARFAIFGRDLSPTTAGFWFMMQIAMALGFLTAYPVNWWLAKSGVKDRM